jgi:myosin heavy subunit
MYVEGTNDANDYRETVNGTATKVFDSIIMAQKISGKASKINNKNYIKVLFMSFLTAMNVIGITQAEQRDIFRILAAILHLGNVQFRESGNYACVSDNRG